MSLLMCALGSCSEPVSDPGADGGVDSSPLSVSVSGPPEFRISGGLHRGDSLFFNGVVRGRFLRDGQLSLALAWTNEVVVIDSVGQISMVLGGDGDGPGELRAISDLIVAGEGLYAWDPRRSRLTAWSRSGEVVSASSVNVPPGQTWVGLLGPYRYVTGPRSDGVWALAAPEEFTPDSANIYVVRSLESGDSLGVVDGGPERPGSSRLDLEFPGSDRSTFASFDLGESCLPRMHASVLGDSLVIVDPSVGSIALATVEGRRTVSERQDPAGTVSQTFVDAIRDWVSRTEREMGPATRQSKNQVMSRIGEPDSPLQSVWSRLLVEAPGRLWLRRASCSVETVPERWQVMALDGSTLGNVDLPAGYSLMDVRSDRLLVKDLDGLGVERISVFSVPFDWVEQ